MSVVGALCAFCVGAVISTHRQRTDGMRITPPTGDGDPSSGDPSTCDASRQDAASDPLYPYPPHGRVVLSSGSAIISKSTTEFLLFAGDGVVRDDNGSTMSGITLVDAGGDRTLGEIRPESVGVNVGWAIIQAPQHANGAGPCFVFSAIVGDPDSGADGYIVHWCSGTRSVLWKTRADEPGVLFGHALIVGGDYDGDGVSDVLATSVGCLDCKQRSGALLVISSADGKVLRTMYRADASAKACDRFGISIAALGDLNQDGMTDFAVGRLFPPTVDILDGATLSVRATITGRRFAFFGWTVASTYQPTTLPQEPGEVRLLVTAPNGAECCCGYTISKEFEPTLLFATCPQGLHYHCGCRAVVVEDCDGDGIRDFAVTAPGYPPRSPAPFLWGLKGAVDVDAEEHASHCGNLYVISSTDGSTIQASPIGDIDETLGAGMNDCGDCDGDGHRDLVLTSSIRVPFTAVLYSVGRNKVIGKLKGVKFRPQ